MQNHRLGTHRDKIEADKSQLISKKSCQAITSSKKRTKRTQDTILSAFGLNFQIP